MAYNQSALAGSVGQMTAATRERQRQQANGQSTLEPERDEAAPLGASTIP